ncbi:MAG: hypothetical protein NW224_20220 [Leptolyngbyaceae cyanobacterium bins.302]|nr:hypothetical protein [Leptolyngbyaceae cyanobacterium bins.302]
MKTVLWGSLLFVGTAISIAIAACAPTTTTSETTNQPSPDDSPVNISTTQTTSSFDEALYLFANSDVKELINRGKYQSGLDHYEQVGQTAKKPDGERYESFFTGTNGNDTVQGFGKGEHAHFAGVKIEIVDQKGDPFPLRPVSLGKGEMDVLMGTTEGGNEFLIGSFITSVNPKPEPFYVGQGDADYARIQNFTPTKDSIIVAGEPAQYNIEPVDGNVRISTNGDLVAIVEGVTQLKVGEVVKDYGVFTLK